MATSFCPYTKWWILFININTKRSICVLKSLFHSVISSTSFSSFPSHSGAKGVCVRRSISAARRRERVTGGYLHCRAWPSSCRGFLGDRAVWTKWEAKSRWAKWHHHNTCALHVAATELRSGEDTHLCGASPDPSDWVPHTLRTKCSV